MEHILCRERGTKIHSDQHVTTSGVDKVYFSLALPFQSNNTTIVPDSVASIRPCFRGVPAPQTRKIFEKLLSRVRFKAFYLVAGKNMTIQQIRNTGKRMRQGGQTACRKKLGKGQILEHLGQIKNCEKRQH